MGPARSAAVWLLVSVALPEKASESHTLTLAVEGVRNSKGVIGVLVFNSRRGWPENTEAAFRRIAVRAQQGLSSVAISNLPEGDYAVVVLHDENENMKLDRNWLGIPKEQWGMSNNPPVFMSIPSFDAARFRLRSDLRMRIRLRIRR